MRGKTSFISRLPYLKSGKKGTKLPNSNPFSILNGLMCSFNFI